MCEEGDVERMYRSLNEQGLIERVDMEGPGGGYSTKEVVENVLARLRERIELLRILRAMGFFPPPGGEAEDGPNKD